MPSTTKGQPRESYLTAAATRRAQLTDYYRAAALRGAPPTLEDAADHFGVSISAIRHDLDALIEAGIATPVHTRGGRRRGVIFHIDSTS